MRGAVGQNKIMVLFVIIIVSIILAVLLYLKGRGRGGSGNDDIHGQPPDAGDMGGNL